jgi:diaminopimelate epimerase
MSDRRLLYCATCNAKYDVSGVRSGNRFICRSCRTVIRIPDHLGLEAFFKGGESREVLKPQLILDEARGEGPGEAERSFEFTKMVATENDYVLVDCMLEELADPQGLAKVLCNRRRGVGSDGLLLFLPSSRADFRMRMFNPDGSEAEMCGNGIRCLARFAFDHEYTRKSRFVVETGGGLKNIELRTDEEGIVRAVRVDMGRAEVEKVPGGAVDLKAAGRTFRGVPVSVGNPHFVIFTEDVDAVPLNDWGPAIENHTRFPNRTNVEFVRRLSSEEVVQRTHERGVGETLGCGTGATAVCAAGRSLGLLDARTTVHLRGGDLVVEIDAGGSAFLTGPAVEVFSGTWTPGGLKTGIVIV